MTITKETIKQIQNPTFRSYANQYLQIEEETNKTIEGFGLLFSKKRSRLTKEDVLQNHKIVARNEKKSLYSNWISPACKACKTGEKSHTSFISLKCHKKCYFCFNPNQENYSTFRVKNNDVIAELDERLQKGEKFDHIALTGGEPLLHPKEAIAFLNFVEKELPTTYTRMYTAGDLLTIEILTNLKEVNLNEIRFSIKQEETAEQMEKLFDLMKLAKDYIPFVVVEMPVIPGTLQQMQDILHRLDEIGINGINLLEFCYPLHNTEEFIRRGFALNFPPYETYYNYWYAGGLAVDKSEEECLQLLQYAAKNELKLGVHYCSLENKHTGQVYLQNKDSTFSKLYSFSNKDFFIKSAKVFGEDKERTLKLLNKHKIKNYEIDENTDSLQFPISAIKHLKGLSIDIAICFYMSEFLANEEVLREVKLEWIKS
ncbi:radical SAM protein [Robertmurraya massiliosenegalensis]|uniref:radical SAM protein n=1 Tax=Robertmurraya TaxID=2837507 RepID=UPI0039A50B6B